MHQINLYTSCLNNTLILPKNEIRKFIDSFDDVTKRLDQTVQSFESLKTTRVNKLEKSFEELDQVNKQLED